MARANPDGSRRIAAGCANGDEVPVAAAPSPQIISIRARRSAGPGRVDVGEAVIALRRQRGGVSAAPLAGAVKSSAGSTGATPGA